MSDSETTGWKRDSEGGYTKDIDRTFYFILPIRGGGWWLKSRYYPRTYHEYMDAAKRAAHAHASDTARLWAGETTND